MADLSEIVKKEYVEGDNTLCFETTPIWKIVFLSIITLGLYDFILLYRYWKTLKENFGYKVNSFVRGFMFGPFFNFELFKIFKKYMNSFGVETKNSSLLATIFFILATLGSISDRLSMQHMNDNLYDKPIAILTLVSMWTFLIVIYYQKRINTINEQHYPMAKVNKWGLANTLWAIPLTLYIFLVYFGYLFMLFGLTE